MTVEQVIALSRLCLEAAFWVAAPILIAGMAISLTISIVQVMTSIQEPTVSAVPRLAAVGTVIFLLLPWMLHRLVVFTVQLFGDFHAFAR
ncbi:MAG TPA: flagellar biosynthetic protein FliQ [Candidatus Aquilonibacter sp.]|nr:flagellar biosynthetic protein FliQ [Candidatus Aquilonibacter sp.]